MTIEAYLAFALAMLALAVSPGPGVATVVGVAFERGFAHAVAAIVGLVFGDILYMLCAVIGVSAIAQAFGELFFLIRLASGCYLVYLGWKLLRQRGTEESSVSVRREGSYPKSLALGFGVTLGNPKVILFYLTFLPAFLDIRKMSALDAAGLAAIIAIVSLIVLGAYARLAGLSARYFVSTGLHQRVRKATGATLMIAGAAVVARR